MVFPAQLVGAVADDESCLAGNRIDRKPLDHLDGESDGPLELFPGEQPMHLPARPIQCIDNAGGSQGGMHPHLQREPAFAVLVELQFRDPFQRQGHEQIRCDRLHVPVIVAKVQVPLVATGNAGDLPEWPSVPCPFAGARTSLIR